ncbi:MAG TPA: 1-acyl-sn-glycerol-3-phosphate acyltransferase [Deltaproteobacteria bacterium]|nr:1-acyl-sn-glycerol-3-phosphate acyltransferase [Deltaproteobacteria bacterium]HPR55838.1 1-acyl-sn-glycerol-3-phosphate acyltransferase [Deltaproteobacteria bacterium]HXK47693.1 1-acyl-sn-glycerol-3-phosphate acyltransferase [Deltaproteobacteria bacterium]
MNEKKPASPFTFSGTYGPLLRPFMRRLFSPINIPELYKESIASLAQQGHIVFAHGSKSSMDAFLLNFRMQRDGLPSPTLVFGSTFPLFQPVMKALWRLASLFSRTTPFDGGFYRDFMEDRRNASMIYLDAEPSREDLDPILELLKIQRETDTPIFLVPQRIVYHRAPFKLKDTSDEEQVKVTGFRKFVTLIRGREHGFVEHGEPVNLKDELKRALSGRKFFEELAPEIRSDLLHRLAVLGSNISGAPIRDRSFLIEKTRRDPILQSYLRSHAKGDSKAMEEAESTVVKHLDQIAADLSPAAVNLLDRSLTWVFNNIFEGLDMDPKGLQAVREMARNGSLVYVPCHKSHIDYLILSYCLYENWMSVPVVAAGINLAFFPIGGLLRKGGAFFMKRTFKDNPLYAQTFGAYVRTLLGERIPLEFFIEGTRSRSGKLMLPKKGLLSMIVQGWESGVSRDVIFVPVYVGYDTVVEENAYIQEMKGAPKEKENFWQLLRAGSILKNRYGKVYIRFADPISLNGYMQTKAAYSRMDAEQKERVYDDVADRIISSIYEQTVATPFALLSCVLLSAEDAMEEEALKKGFHVFLEYLKHLGCNLSSTLAVEDESFRDALAIMKSKGLVAIDEGSTEAETNLVMVEDEDRIHLEYYKNTILNFFVPASLIANVLLKNRSGIVEKSLQKQVRNLASLLGNEFILDLESFVKAVRFMTETGIVTVTKGMYTAGKDAADVLKMFGGLIENYLESYLCVATNLDKVKDVGGKDILKAINRHATRMFKKGEIKRFESLCLPVYKGALDTFRTKGLIDEKYRTIDERPIKELVHEIEEYLQT